MSALTCYKYYAYEQKHHHLESLSPDEQHQMIINDIQVQL
jgi:hypothetical protein